MAKYRKMVEAFQMTRERRWNNSEWPNWLQDAWQKPPSKGGLWADRAGTWNAFHNDYEELVLATLDGVRRISWGDFIIQGENGKLFLSKPDIFADTYEEVPN